MSKIQNLNLSALRNEEAFGFLQQVQAETKYLTDATIESIIDNLTTSLEEFDKALKESDKLPSVALARECDTARDTAWSGLNAYCKAVATYHPDADVKATAQKTYDIVLKYGNPIRLPQTQESGVLHNLLQDLNALPAEDRTKAALDAWINHLSECENNFLAAVGERTVEESARINGIVKQTRTARSRLPQVGGSGERTERTVGRVGLHNLHRPRERTHRPTENYPQNTFHHQC